MRWRRLIWLVAGLLLLAVLWRRGQHPAPQYETHRLAPIAGTAAMASVALKESRVHSKPSQRLPLSYRLANSSKTLSELLASDRAILLENALVDTTQPLTLGIPESLRSIGEPGSYIVQSHAPLTASFRALLQQAGANPVAYIPNNALLVRASLASAQALAGDPQVQAVLPYEPYYKLKPSLLKMVLDAPGSAQGSQVLAGDSLGLNLLLFADARDSTLSTLEALGAEIVAEEQSPFGPALRVRASLSMLPALARLPGVQEVELARTRVPANDLSRALLGVSANSVTLSNYLELSGSNVLINVNDTGVDAGHPDLAGRVIVAAPGSGVDTNGHGTHVAGIIAGSGAQSLSVTNAPGSSMPPAPLQFRGKAPRATILSLAITPSVPSLAADVYLQQTAALSNAFIANNSWQYQGDNEYDLAAASYDAATRDALPDVPGSQSVLFVFAGGNGGQGANDGTGGNADTIQSPGTAKNVLTIGAIEQTRFITNQTWTCSTNGVITCQTNAPWLPLTDNSNAVAGFSARGNVGLGVEGDAGRFKPDLVAPGTFIISTRSTQWDQRAYYTQTNNSLVPSPDENYFAVLSNLNDSLGPFYRFESGTSLAAAEVSGVLALIQDFFQNRLAQTNSPALTKALVLNGARSLGGPYDLHPGLTNFQGWGLINLTNSLPPALTNLGAGGRPMLLFDQNSTNALATGQSQARVVTLTSLARSEPLRFTLVWTDPPGNPVAALKLVNDLDLVVTNLDTGEVYFGNDIPAGRIFNGAWDTNTTPNFDRVNNVENVFLVPPLGTNYSFTVIGRRVNVNAVTANTNDIVQDYALVVSSGNGRVADALTLNENPVVPSISTQVTFLTNTFLASPGDAGALVLRQRVGANPSWPGTNTIPLPISTNALLTIGSLNQWHFFVLTNDTSFTNAAFLTFSASTLSSGDFSFGANSSPAEPDIDLYVSMDPGLTNLAPAALAAADKSLGRGGSESIVYSNASPGVYYVGVKCESQQGAEFSFLGVFSELPFADTDLLGNQTLRGFPAPVLVPGGSFSQPGAADLICLAAGPIPVRRVIVTNTLTTPAMSALAGEFTHGGASVYLNNHSPSGAVVQQAFVYDDSGEGDMPGAQPSDGPGSLRDFAGSQGLGQWRLTMTNTNQPGTNEALSVFLENQPDLVAGIAPTLQPGACRQDFIFVPIGVTNLTATVNLPFDLGPVSVQLCPVGTPGSNCLTLVMGGPGANLTLTCDAASHPPLNPGLYVLRMCNSGPDAASVSASVTLLSDPIPPSPVVYTCTNWTPLLDDATSIATLYVTNPEPVTALTVGVRIEHPRVSDLALRLVSPSGKRVLLQENRGGASTEGLGCDVLATNMTRVSFTGGPQAVTNVVDTGQTMGTVSINYDFYSLPDDMRVYYEGNLIFDSGLVSNTGSTNLAFGPGASTSITIVMNEFGNLNTNTAWFYSASSTQLVPLYLTFTEDTNLALVPIKFAAPPLTNVNYLGNGSIASNAIFYLPEESLDRLVGEPAAGPWRLEITDTRAGATDPLPTLSSWQLALLLRQPLPAPLAVTPGSPATNALGPGQIQWFTIDVPGWASFATNTLLAVSAPVNLWFDSNAPPTGTNVADVELLLNSNGGSRLLQTNAAPVLVPGARYYLGVENTNLATVSFALEVDFDVPGVIVLQSGVPYAANNPGPAHPADYYLYVVTSNALRAQFEVNGPSADVALVARRGLPLPTLASFDYLSDAPGTNDELLVLYDYSSPVPLTPGNWFLGVINVSGLPASYSILATEFSAYGTNLFITSQSAATNSFCFTWTSLPGIHYYVQGKAEINDPAWSIVSPTVTADDFQTTYCLPLPSPFHFFRVHEGRVILPPPLVISSIITSTNGVLLNWSASTNSQFKVQWSSSLVPAAWTSFTNVVSSTNGGFSFLDDGSQSGGLGRSRCYRLQQLP